MLIIRTTRTTIQTLTRTQMQTRQIQTATTQVTLQLPTTLILARTPIHLTRLRIPIRTDSHYRGLIVRKRGTRLADCRVWFGQQLIGLQLVKIVLVYGRVVAYNSQAT